MLEELDIRYILGGSLASVVHGEPRSTLDVDFAVDLDLAHVDAFLSAVKDDFHAFEDHARAEVARRGSFQLVHRRTMTRVDIFVPEWQGIDEWKWIHRVRLRVGDSPADVIDVTNPEGIVLQKLIWFGKGGETSDRQWRDVLGVIKAQRGGLDIDEMRRLAVSNGIGDLLRRALEAAGV